MKNTARLGLSLALLIQATGCSSQRINRDPSGQSARVLETMVNAGQIARMESENKGLFIAEDTSANRFTVIECSRQKDARGELMLEGAACAPLVSYFLPGTPESRAAFDEAFKLAVDQENKVLNNRWSLKDTIKNVAIGSFVSFLSKKALITYRLRVQVAQEGPRTINPFMGNMIVAASVLLGVGTVAVIEAVEMGGRADRTLDRDLLSKYKTLNPNQVAMASLEIYTALRSALTVAMASQVTL